LSAHPAHRLFVATGNPGKLAEFRALIAEAALDVEVVGLADLPAPYVEPVEDGASFAENALIKARAGVAASGLPTLADDSGICVDALNGMPGIYSARWSGNHADHGANLKLLVDQLRDVPVARRRAHYEVVLVLAHPDGTHSSVHARWDGAVATAPRGDHGFGYDPIFLPDDPEAAGPDGRRLSSAELDPAVKDRISHRGQAFVAALPMLRAAFPS
jgi:XTP/dITP diphosphohydrolase